VLALRRSFLKQLQEKSPDDAFLFYEAICRVIVERIAER